MRIKKLYNISITMFFILVLAMCSFKVGATTVEKKQVEQTTLEMTAPSYLLMEESTGQIIKEQNSNEKRSPASITKVMTLILIFEQLKSGKMKLEDKVITSAKAKSMGGSQVFLEEGEEQTVETLIKCIIIASGNDASVAMAEYIGGSEEAFVVMMNERAKELGMAGTHFVDCCGLTEDENHYSTANDVAIMSRELSTKYPEVHKYSSIWMEDIIHVTKKGEKQFTLSNTNKLIRQYEGATGLKTGSTSKAKFCLSATATRKDVRLIAVVMGCPDSKARVKDASKLLDYGFANCVVYEDVETAKSLPQIQVLQGMKKMTTIQPVQEFRHIFIDGKKHDVSIKFSIKKELKAPIKKGQEVGTIDYYVGKDKIGSVLLQTGEAIEKLSYGMSLWRIWNQYIQ